MNSKKSQAVRMSSAIRVMLHSGTQKAVSLLRNGLTGWARTKQCWTASMDLLNSCNWPEGMMKSIWRF